MIETSERVAKERGSYLATLRAIVKLLDICLQVLRAARRNRLTVQMVEDKSREICLYALQQSQTELQISGAEKLDPSKAYLYMSNHESLMDIPVIQASAPRSPRMVTKKELFKVPIWGKAMKVSGFISIDRKNRESAIESLNQTKRLMEEGISVWMAPEGTRSRDGNLLPFKKGGFMLALETGFPIVPVGIHGSRQVIRPKSFKSFLGQRVTVRYGAPIDPLAYGMERRDELMEDVRQAIEELRRR